MDKVLVIGASGFVGSAVVAALSRSAAYTPVAATRGSKPQAGGIEYRVCDATNRDALDRALAGVTVAVSCLLGAPQAMIESTRLLCEAATRRSLRRVVLMSSMSVYGAAEGHVDETASLAGGDLGPYGAAKTECERIAARFIAEGAPITILRPGIVYGPGGDQWIGRFARLLRRGRIGDLGALGDGICNLIYKDDVGAAVIAVLRTPPGEAFNLSDGEFGTWNDFIIQLGCLTGVPHIRRLSARRIHIETHLAAPPLQLLKLAQSRLLKKTPWLDPIPASLVALWGQRLHLDSRKAERLLGLKWTPRVRGLLRSAEWVVGRSDPAPLRHAVPQELRT